ncbi:MAG: GNAT family N-acetyltransferase [Anaerolineaceae bacterium]|nr:GNAT family N-acetyltransferase [Anaerolineaceae bacterium]
MEYQELQAEMINRELFAHFTRHQVVSQCWRKVDGQWCIKDIAFTDDWDEADYRTLIACLQSTLAGGGVVFGAFEGGRLKGFASVEAKLFGKNKGYLDLTSLHVSEDVRGKGIGKALFRLSKAWAMEHGAQKLYISAHSSVETQAFYKAMGCVEAVEYNEAHVEAEPCDCQMECVL